MILKHIGIINFKNIAEAEIDFSPRVNALLGTNGMGKSNMLEAIHFLSFARAMTVLPENSLIRHGEDMLLVKGDYAMDSGADVTISCGIVRGKGKTLKLNGKEYTKVSEHIGRFPIVTVSPADTLLVSGGADGRRRLMDMVISQADPTYLPYLIRYNKSLESRNRMLKAGIRDTLLYESVENAMEEAAVKVYESRKRWAEETAGLLSNYYERIAGTGETASLQYHSVLDHMDFKQVMHEQRVKDSVLGFTSRGVHRDDFATGLGEYSMRALGSQGQVKTYAVALRFAIFDYIKRSIGLTPVLLLDDIFDKLDAGRVERIMDVVSGDDNFGQIFITDTNRKHLDDIIGHLGGDPLLLEVSEGRFSPIETGA